MKPSGYLSMQDKSVETVYGDLLTKGVSEYDASALVGWWILDNLGKTKRVFNYKQDFTEASPGCTSSFLRSLAHADWIDGESVVQAEQTSGEDGFNTRFHNIEDDFDSVKDDLSTIFGCVSDMREQIFNRFDEIKTELNRINNDIHSCCNKDDGGITYPWYQYGGIASSGVKYMGTSKVNDNYVSVWQSSQGLMMLPSAYTIGLDVMKDDRVQASGIIAEFIEDTPSVKEEFTNGRVTKKDFVKKFGDSILSNEKSLVEILEILPDDSKFKSLELLVDDISKREAAAIRTRKGADSAIADSFGIDSDIESIKDAPIADFGVIPKNIRIVLLKEGLNTIDKFGNEDRKTISKIIKDEGLTVSNGDVANWIATARTLSLIR